MSRHLPERCTMIRLLIPPIHTIPLMHFKLNGIYLKSIIIVYLSHLLIPFIAECD
jgi:hypothetical protein